MLIPTQCAIVSVIVADETALLNVITSHVALK